MLERQIRNYQQVQHLPPQSQNCSKSIIMDKGELSIERLIKNGH